MKRYRAFLLLALILLPVAVLIVAGGWALWKTGWLYWLWWLLPLCWVAAYLIARSWRSKLIPLPEAEFKTSVHWTQRDEEAAAVVVEAQNAVAEVPPPRLVDPQFYLETAKDLALRVAKAYHPKAEDPVNELTIADILTAVRLAADDLEKWVRQYVPASHLLTVGQWRSLGKTPDWLKTVSDLSWAGSMLFKLSNIARYAVWKTALKPVTREMHHNVLASFYVMFIRQVGLYLIEMNSGRLRGGTESYLEAVARLQGGEAKESPQAMSDSEPTTVTIALIGQAKAGKSSLINALTGRRAAATDVLPETAEVRRYQYELADFNERLVLLDTPGYGQEGPSQRQLVETRRAVRDSDLALLVMDASSPARAADDMLLGSVTAWFAARSHLKPPPILGVLTHIDLLTPALEWTPPYDWTEPKSTKEESIQGAVSYHLEQLGPLLAGVVPVCSDVDHDREFGIQQWLVPVMSALLEDARACAVLRMLHTELDKKRFSALLNQVASAGRELIKAASGQPASGPL